MFKICTVCLCFYGRMVCRCVSTVCIFFAHIRITGSVIKTYTILAYLTSPHLTTLQHTYLDLPLVDYFTPIVRCVRLKTGDVSVLSLLFSNVSVNAATNDTIFRILFECVKSINLICILQYRAEDLLFVQQHFGFVFILHSRICIYLLL